MSDDSMTDMDDTSDSDYSYQSDDVTDGTPDGSDYANADYSNGSDYANADYSNGDVTDTGGLVMPDGSTGVGDGMYEVWQEERIEQEEEREEQQEQREEQEEQREQQDQQREEEDREREEEDEEREERDYEMFGG